MNRVARGFEELVGLFVDDWRYALAILIWIGAVALLARFFGLPPAMRGLALAGGLIIVYLGSFASRR